MAEGDSPGTEEEEDTDEISLEVPVQDLARHGEIQAFQCDAGEVENGERYVADASSDAFLL
jgi:hypothetical protein